MKERHKKRLERIIALRKHRGDSLTRQLRAIDDPIHLATDEEFIDALKRVVLKDRKLASKVSREIRRIKEEE